MNLDLATSVPTSHAEPLRPPLRQRLFPIIGLLLLSPIAAEYLIGFDTMIGDPLFLLFWLLPISMLYGTVAVLIREIARRAGRGWPAIVLLSVAFGLIQAGLIDQGLFNPHYIDDPSWAETRQATLLPGLDVSLGHFMDFIPGHVIWSFAAPIAVIEACVPSLARRSWVGRAGVFTLVALYLSAATFILVNHITTRQFIAAPAHLAGTALAAVALASLALIVPHRMPTLNRPAPSPWLVGATSFVCLTTYTLAPPSWVGVAVKVVVLALLGLLLFVWSRGRSWEMRHVLAAGGGALLVRASLAFAVDPLGNPDEAGKYVSNTIILTGVVILLAWAFRQQRRQP